MEVLRVEGVRKVYGSGALALTALEDVSLRAHTGELVALLGPSGSGKSTLLLCISLILEPTAGSVTVNGTTIYDNGWTGIDTRRFRRENIGFVFQAKNLIPFLSAVENVALAMTLNGVPARDARKRARDLLVYLEIGHRAGAMPAELSGGEQQRVAIARALANEPPLILADEPTASLDTERGMKVMDLLKRIALERHSAVIVVTHDERMIVGFDVVYRLKDGHIIQEDGARQTHERSLP
ncbi:MAG TPA: ABC transporter ATP-binding protein [Candidatus Dormibacteraeota bacterium]|nr:ABC transporter ATP-binding protein [Candidatus Dormibacteraeota bacterium]